MPLAAHAVFSGETLKINATWGDPEGQMPLVQTQALGSVSDTAAAVALGEKVAIALQAGVDKATGKA